MSYCKKMHTLKTTDKIFWVALVLCVSEHVLDLPFLSRGHKEAPCIPKVAFHTIMLVSFSLSGLK